MAFDALQDRRRLSLLLLASALAFCLVLVAAVLAERNRFWRQMQREAVNLKHVPAFWESGIAELRACDDRIDRCTTCHVAAPHRADDDAERSAVFRSHSSLLDNHPFQRFGCVACHGGTGRSLDMMSAHAIPGTSVRDPFMGGPTQEATCGRCHVPGSVPGTERLARGAELYYQLGCQMCHPHGTSARSHTGPDLETIGRRTLEQLRTSILEPTSNLDDTTMPSFQSRFARDKKGFDDLATFVSYLGLRKGTECASKSLGGNLWQQPCVVCHGTPDGRAVGHFRHACQYIVTRRDELACSRCHGQGNGLRSQAATRCPLIERHSPVCTACHAASGGQFHATR